MENNRILVSCAICIVQLIPLVAATNDRCNLSCDVSLIAALVASDASDLLSTVISSIFLPSMPSLLIFYSRNSIPSRWIDHMRQHRLIIQG